MAKRKFYIPTSIVYTNQSPHIGFALEVIQADVLARYHRLLGEEVFFLTGTDEHGTKNVQAAKEAGKTLEDFTEEISKRVKDLTKILNLSNDDFIRTTDKKRHWPTVEKVWLKLKENRDIYKKKYKGFYCVGCEAFVKEKDLIDGKCPIHEKAPEIIEEENYFFCLSKYQNQLKKIIETGEIKIIPESRRSELLSFINQGLEDTSCSRLREKLEWGIPVPDDKTQSVYVWLEALVNYLSALDYATDGDKFKKFWPPDVHCIGKDIFIRFHGSLWPAMLLSLELELPKTIFVHGFITVSGQKMSKSLGNVIDPFELVKKYGTDPVRYFLLREIPPTEDGDFTYQKFESRYNADLANGIGNTVSRVLTMTEKYWKGIIPKVDKNKIGLNAVGYWIAPGTGRPPFTLKQDSEQKHKFLSNFFEQFLFNSGLTAISNFVRNCDIYIDAYKLYKPSEVLENNKEKIDVALYDVLEGLRQVGWMLLPFMPETADRIFEQLGLDPEKEKKKEIKEAIKWGGLKPGTKTKKGKPLFPRI